MTTTTNDGRRALLDDIMLQHQSGNETLGVAIRRLRLEVTGLDQETFAAMCKISTRALYQIEKDMGNPTLGTLDAILRKFGMRLGLTQATQPAYMPQPEQPGALPKSPTRGVNPRRKTAKV